MSPVRKDGMLKHCPTGSHALQVNQVRELMRPAGQVVVDGLLLGLITGEAEKDHVVVDFGLEVHGAVPEFVEIF